MGIKASNQVTVVDVTDAFSVNLTSDSYTFVGDTNGAAAGLTCMTQVIAYCGTELCQKIYIEGVNCPPEISATISDNDSPYPLIKFTTTDILNDSCEAEIGIRAFGDNNEAFFVKKFSFAVAKEGSAGMDGKDGQMLYAVCETSSEIQAKIATVKNESLTLKTGSTVAVYFVNANTAASPTLNINGTGAKSIKINDSTEFSKEYYWVAKSLVTFVYDGTCWKVSDSSALSKAADAAKTATNFMGYDEANGLQIGNKTNGSWTGYRTQVKSDSFNVLDSNGTAIASYGTNKIELGKNNDNSVISLCNDKGTIKYNTDKKYDEFDYLEIYSNHLLLNSSSMYAHSEGFNTLNVSDGSTSPYWKSESSIYITDNGNSASLYSKRQDTHQDGTLIADTDISSAVSVSPQEVYIRSSLIAMQGEANLTGNINVGSLSVKGGGIELNNGGSLSGYGGFIDFHYNKSTSDYTSRIIEDANGQLNLIATNGVKANGDIIKSGTWTPSCAAIPSPTKAFGSYMRIGKTVTINFCIYGAATSGSGTGSFSLRITGLPIPPNKNVRWYSGGGNAAGIKTPANYSFCGFNIEHDTNSSTNYGSIILPRCTQMTTSAGTRSSNYCTNPGSGTIYMAGTIMYSTT